MKKKISALILAGVVASSVVVPAYAAPSNPEDLTRRIENQLPGTEVTDPEIIDMLNAFERGESYFDEPVIAEPTAVEIETEWHVVTDPEVIKMLEENERLANETPASRAISRNVTKRMNGNYVNLFTETNSAADSKVSLHFKSTTGPLFVHANIYYKNGTTWVYSTVQQNMYIGDMHTFTIPGSKGFQINARCVDAYDTGDLTFNITTKR